MADNISITIRLPEEMVRDVMKLVEIGAYNSRTDLIKYAVRKLLERERETRNIKELASLKKGMMSFA